MTTRFLLALLLATTVSCGPGTAPPPPPDPETARLGKEAAGRTLEFGFALYAQLLREKGNESLFVSPPSIALALAMAQAGAGGGTREEIAQVLHGKSLKPGEVDRHYSALMAVLRSADPQVRVDIANSAWTRKGVPFRKEYVSLLADRYGARAEELDFAGSKAPATINAWVKDRTSGKIDRVVPDSIPPDAVLYLINAVYFKGEWTEKFDKSATKVQPFHLPGGGTKDHPFMIRTGTYGYLETPELRAIRIPYGRNNRMAFYVFLPPDGSTLAEFHPKLTAENWKAWMAGVGSRECRLEMPRFKLECGLHLIPALAALGMPRAFKRGADFSGMSPLGNELFINSVLHKTFVEVNEEGTEAAAVTAVGATIVSVPPPPIPFKVDRPFFCAIRDDESGAILFMGSILEPL